VCQTGPGAVKKKNLKKLQIPLDMKHRRRRRRIRKVLAIKRYFFSSSLANQPKRMKKGKATKRSAVFSDIIERISASSSPYAPANPPPRERALVRCAFAVKIPIFSLYCHFTENMRINNE
jgi:hypothetical protein